jgi:hypothetical protein
LLWPAAWLPARLVLRPIADEVPEGISALEELLDPMDELPEPWSALVLLDLSLLLDLF